MDDSLRASVTTRRAGFFYRGLVGMVACWLLEPGRGRRRRCAGPRRRLRKTGRFPTTAPGRADGCPKAGRRPTTAPAPTTAAAAAPAATTA